jgi:hypothetical protein|tara:strand:- start:3994 stop:4146 length:153 start_codon:yes stop_codon:yes gene_type:complete
MLDTILELLNQDEYLAVSKNIDIAKGKYKIPTSIKQKRKQYKREKAWLRK